ncbi:phage portal protein [Rubinisphaera sp.]|uniref:phage portal protein n=1 Tax=Rubinisphaera sp. TaxID=2024857 RepID=UPI000C0F0185|nr:phage portal protein [Rubinisphaera sp.]MBV12401.1 phage portal protein [Rubinisphaera sp.]HCS50100.1 phage portal protein [Planctomycetaceae bacterium]|tara:strand:- start:11944 stop:13527 length:1584 start_codon:yes stop_codon:yes gene_type:complete
MFSFFSRSKKPEKRSSITSAKLVNLGNYADSSQIVVTEDTSLQLVTVRSCVDLIAQTIATLSLHGFERIDGERERIDEHPIARLIHRPNSMMTSIDWLECLMNRVLLYGNSFDFLDYSGGRPVGIYPLENNKVKIIRPNGELLYQVTINGVTRELEPYQILHCKGFSTNGIQGISPISHAARVVASGLSMDRIQQRFFDNGSHLGGILKHPERLSEEAKDNLRSQIESKHRGVDNAFRFMILQEGMDYEPLGLPQDQAQFVEQRKLNTLDILRIFHVPSHMMAVTEGSMSFASVEHMGISFYRNTIRPWIKKLEAEFNQKLWQESEKSRFYLEFDPASLLRGDQKSEDESFRTGSQWGWWSINEIRQKKNLPPIENGDLHYRPLNYAPIEQDNSPIVELEKDDSTIGETETDSENDDRSIDLSELIEDAHKRVLTKEIKAIQRAVKKYEPAEFISWANEFYGSHAETVRSTFSPVMRANGTVDRIDNLAQKHCNDHLQQLSLACWTDEPQAAVEHLLNTWRQNGNKI